MCSEKDLSNALNNGLNFISKEQQIDGSFVSLSSSSPTDFKKALKFHSVFSTTIILQALTSIGENDIVQKVKDKSVEFLLAQKSVYGSWNYWTRGSQEAKLLPYPDDLDDTFCALTAIFLCDKQLVTTEMITKAVRLLTTLETKEGGPYRTWLVADNKEQIWKDVDLGVNVNIAYFLFLQDISLPNLTKLFDRALKTRQIASPYYPQPQSILYFLARFLSSRKHKSLIIKEILKQDMDGPLSLAVGISSLIRLGHPTKEIEKLIDRLIISQKRNGSWPPEVFYTGVNPKKDRMFYGGSTTLSTALSLEAISLYLRRLREISNSVSQRLARKKAELIYRAVIKKVEKRFGQLGKHLQAESWKYSKQLLKNDKDKQITLLPLLIARSLKGGSKKVPFGMMVDLGAASVYGWIAYTIYDNFLDEEAETSSLPLANVCLRELTIIFDNVLPDKNGFKKVFQKIMDSLEEANSWEVKNCRVDRERSQKMPVPKYGKYQFLADRSLGHSLGSIAIFMSLGFKEKSKEVKNLVLFFKHFLIARQLNDDAHDWEKDLKFGQVNSVGALLLSKGKDGDLQKLFWEDVVEEVCGLIEIHAVKARSALFNIEIIDNKEPLNNLIKKQEATVQITREEKQKTLSFIENYEKTLSS
jgi:hypothetical protein